MARITGKHVSATIPVELHAILDEYRWENKVDKFTDVIRDALSVFAQDHLGYEPEADSGDAPKS